MTKNNTDSKKEEQGFFFTCFYQSKSKDKANNEKNQIWKLFQKAKNIFFRQAVWNIIIMSFLAIFAYNQNCISEKTNEIADFTLGINDKTMKISNRAYITIADPQFFGKQIYGKDKMTYNVRNDGPTPAYAVSDCVYFEWRTRGNPRIPISTDTSTQWIYGPGIHTKVKLLNENWISEKKALEDTIDTNIFRRYFSGRIEYIDIFDSTHTTTFCYEFVYAAGGRFNYYKNYTKTN